MIKLSMVIAGIGMAAAVSLPATVEKSNEAKMLAYAAPVEQTQQIEEVVPEQRYMQTVQTRATRQQLIRACNNIKDPRLRKKCLSRAK